MHIKDLISGLFSSSAKGKGYHWEADSEGLNLFTTESTTLKINKGNADILVTHQHVALRMLVEQEEAEAIPNSFIIPTARAVRLDEYTRQLLALPPQWPGRLKAEIKGSTGNSSFSVSLKAEISSGAYSSSYTIKGPILSLSDTRKYILTPAQEIIFSAMGIWQSSERTEYDNLRVILALQEAQEKGAGIDLAHFDKLDIKAPESITIEAEKDIHGNLILTPYMGQDASHEKVQRVLGQLKSDDTTTLRVGDEIVLFDEKRLAAVHEVLKNRKVPKNKVKQFLEKPTAFIDASLVDLDVGFSGRVHGVTTFKHAYFGETDESGIDWFGTSSRVAPILPISKLISNIDDLEKLERFEAEFGNAVKTGADEVSFEGKDYDIRETEAVVEVIARIKQEIRDGQTVPEEGEVPLDSEIVEEQEVLVVDVDLNDEQVDTPSPLLEKSIENILYPAEKLNWDSYLRKPFEYQAIGVRWIMGLFSSGESLRGGLLADDMGLGKTYMSLAAIDQIYKLDEKSGRTKKPCLIVAPLSVVSNWKEEVEKTFSSSPFDDIVILQSSADLPKYRDTRTVANEQDANGDSVAEVRFTLKIGEKHFNERLDMPGRLVITTYHALRDHQFSLCIADWGMVVFDEAQNIKNPNALQTRAAKGLKADFKLLVTGTPVENSLADFWCLMDAACPGHLQSYQDFRKKYVAPILQAAGDEIEEIRGRVGRQLRLDVGPLMLRRVKEDNLEGLPNKNIFVGLEDNEWKYLPSLRKEMAGQQLEIYDATLGIQDESKSEPGAFLSGLQRLRDVSLHPQLADGGQLKASSSKSALTSLMNESGKLKSLLTVLDDIKSLEQKCIIFVVNKRLQAFLSVALGQAFGLGPISVINGDTKAISNQSSAPTRSSLINDFESKDGFNIIIMSPVAAGVGLTIVGANNVIHLERHWNPAKEAQATDRVYRIGQEKDVNVFIPVLHHPSFESFDVNLHRLLTKKISLKDAVVTPEQVMPTPDGFGTDDIRPTHQVCADDLQRLSWQQFEALCAELFSKNIGASDCWLTQSGSDFGADIVLLSGGVGTLVQCKHTTGAKYDGYKAISEVHSATVKYGVELEKEMKTLIFATNAKILSARTRKIAKQYKVNIYSYQEILELLAKHSISYEMILRRLQKKRMQVS